MEQHSKPFTPQQAIQSDEAANCLLAVGDRTALLLLLMFVLFVLSVPKYNIPGVLAFASLPVLFIMAARIPLTPILKRITIVSPLILFIVAGNLMLDRHPVFRIHGITITGGMVSSTVIAAKTVITLSSLLSLFSCIPFYRFGRALSSLGVPKVFVTQLLLVNRYSMMLSEEAEMMQKARALRSFGNRGKGPLMTARLVGSLLIRSTSRAERIYMAMSARGFRNGLVSTPSMLPTGKELALLAGALAIFTSIRLVF